MRTISPDICVAVEHPPLWPSAIRILIREDDSEVLCFASSYFPMHSSKSNGPWVISPGPPGGTTELFQPIWRQKMSKSIHAIPWQDFPDNRDVFMISFQGEI